MSILTNVFDIHNYLYIKGRKPYLLYMKEYAYMDKYLFIYFCQFIKKSLLTNHSMRGAQLNVL